MPTVADVAHISVERPSDTLGNKHAENSWMLWLAARRVAERQQGTRPAPGGITSPLNVVGIAAELWPTVNWDDHGASTTAINPIYNYLRSSGNAYAVSRKTGIPNTIEWFLSDAWIVSSKASHNNVVGSHMSRRARGQSPRAKRADALKAKTSQPQAVAAVPSSRQIANEAIRGSVGLTIISKAIKTGDPDFPYACPECGQKFEKWQSVGSHRKVHINKALYDKVAELTAQIAELKTELSDVRDVAPGASVAPAETSGLSSMDVTRALEILTDYVTTPPAASHNEEEWRALVDKATSATERLAEAARILHTLPIGEAIVGLMNVIPAELYTD